MVFLCQGNWKKALFANLENYSFHDCLAHWFFNTTGDGVRGIYEFGGLDTACHAVSLYSENSFVILESFTLIAIILEVIR